MTFFDNLMSIKYQVCFISARKSLYQISIIFLCIILFIGYQETIFIGYQETVFIGYQETVFTGYQETIFTEYQVTIHDQIKGIGKTAEIQITIFLFYHK